MKEIYINRILVSDKVCFGNKGFKNFIAYKDVKIRSLYTFLPKVSAQRREFNETEYMSFLIKEDELLEIY